jgi:hypothetical protein
MTALHSSVFLLLISAIIPAAAVWTSAAGAQASGSPVPPAVGPVVVVVDVPAPWYAFEFRAARPVQKRVSHLSATGWAAKAFTIHPTRAQTLFGGIYLWNSEAQARWWFTPAGWPSVAPELDYQARAGESGVMFGHVALRAAGL